MYTWYIAIYSHLSIGTLDDISLKINIHVNASNIGSHRRPTYLFYTMRKPLFMTFGYSISLWITDSSH